MKIGVKVGDVMTRNFVSIKPDASILKCAQVMEEHKVGSLIIEEANKLMGILTKGDIIRAIARKKDTAKTSAKEIMTSGIVTITPDKDMYDALVAMKKRKVRWLPVIEKGKVIGLLTMKDILKIEPSLFDIAMEGTVIREEEAKLRAAELRKKQAGERETLARGMPWAKEGECEECGEFDVLYDVDGRMLCSDCKDEMAEKE